MSQPLWTIRVAPLPCSMRPLKRGAPPLICHTLKCSSSPSTGLPQKHKGRVFQVTPSKRKSPEEHPKEPPRKQPCYASRDPESPLTPPRRQQVHAASRTTPRTVEKEFSNAPQMVQAASLNFARKAPRKVANEASEADVAPASNKASGTEIVAASSKGEGRGPSHPGSRFRTGWQRDTTPKAGFSAAPCAPPAPLRGVPRRTHMRGLR